MWNKLSLLWVLCGTLPAQQFFAPWFLQPGSGFPYQPPNPTPLLWGEPRVFAAATGPINQTTFTSYVAQAKPSGTCADSFFEHSEYVAVAIWDLSVEQPPFNLLPTAHPAWNQIHVFPTIVASPTSAPTGAPGQIGYILGCATSEPVAHYESRWTADTTGLSGFIVGNQWLTLDINNVWKLSASIYYIL